MVLTLPRAHVRTAAGVVGLSGDASAVDHPGCRSGRTPFDHPSRERRVSSLAPANPLMM